MKASIKFLLISVMGLAWMPLFSQVAYPTSAAALKDLKPKIFAANKNDNTAQQNLGAAVVQAFNTFFRTGKPKDETNVVAILKDYWDKYGSPFQAIGVRVVMAPGERDRLQREIDRLRRERGEGQDAFDVERARLARELAQLQAENGQLKRDANSQRVVEDELRAELARLRAERDRRLAAEQQVALLQAQLQSQNDASRKAREDAEKAQAEIARLQREMQAAKVSTGLQEQLAKLVQDSVVLQNTNKALLDQIKQLQDALDKARRDLVDVRNKADAEIAQARKASTSTLMQQYEAVLKELNETKQKLLRAQDELAAAQTYKKAIETKLPESKWVVAELTASNQSLKRRLEEATSELQKAQASITELQARLDQCKEIEATNAALTQQASSAQSQLRDMQQQLQRAQAESIEAKAALDAINKGEPAKDAEVKRLTALNKGLESQISSIKSELGKIADQVATSRRLYDQQKADNEAKLRAAQATIERLSAGASDQDVRRLNQRIEELLEQLRNEREKNASMQTTLDTMDQQLKAAQDEIRKLQAALTAGKEEASEEELEKLGAALKKAQTQVSRLEGEIASLKQDNQNLTENVRGGTERITALNTENKKLQASVRAGESKKAEHEGRIESLEQELKGKEDQVKRCEDKVKDLDKQMRILSQKEADLNAATDAYREQLNRNRELREQKEALEKKIQDLEKSKAAISESEYIKTLTAERDAKAKELKESESEVRKLNARVRDLSTQATLYTNLMPKFNETTKELDEAYKEAAKFKKEKDEAISRLKDLEKALASCRKELAEYDARIRKMKEPIGEAYALATRERVAKETAALAKIMAKAKEDPEVKLIIDSYIAGSISFDDAMQQLSKYQ